MPCCITSSENPIFLQNVLPRGEKKIQANTEDLKFEQRDCSIPGRDQRALEMQTATSTNGVSMSQRSPERNRRKV